ncbi:RMD1 family protein [Pseudoduganella chitinolytica]|uniref:RMD1 family protein n=1 Tax=Pseudoduganella chitinolytica TaxID=34070 RepID=A0ABY8B9Y6_9BURK|nr:RMD1 family protein [Pseudoduganella chitinolytica]WEF32620.1 RMD1 family protein [Pseudoduganella chitinolytica]
MDYPIERKQIRWTPRPRTRPGLHVKTEKLPFQRPVIPHAQFPATAIMVAERIDVRAIAEFEIIAKSPFTVKLGQGGIAAVFRYGAVVLFNASMDEKARLLETIAQHSSGEGDVGAGETATIQVSPDEEEGPTGPCIKIKNADRLRLQLIAEVMAKAAMLSFQERRAARDFDLAEPLARDLAEDGRFSAKPAELLKAVGNMLLAENRLNGRAGVLDRPDLLWDNPGLSGLYARLEGDYELHDRAATLDRKLTTLSHTSETLVETMRYHSSHRLEVAILLLIFTELCLGLYGHFGH